MLQGEVGVELVRQSARAPEKSKTSRTKVWAAEHILPICVRDDFHLPVSISPSSPVEAAVYVVSEFPGRLRTSFFLKSPTQARGGTFV